jgi:hypothetical protein
LILRKFYFINKSITSINFFKTTLLIFLKQNKQNLKT